MNERSTGTEAAKINAEAIERLREIKHEIGELIDEAMKLLRDTPEYDRAKGYWFAHIRCALDHEHAFLGGSMFTLQDSIDALAEVDAGDDEGDDR